MRTKRIEFDHFLDDDAVEIEEAGRRYMVQGPIDGRYIVFGGLEGSASTVLGEPSDLRTVARLLDDAIARHPRTPESFGGFVVEIFRHEGRDRETIAIPTRGALLALFDDGALPSVEELADLLNVTGDYVLRVSDNEGLVLLDRIEEFKRRVAQAAVREAMESLGDLGL